MHWSNPEAQDVEVCSVLDRVIKEVERAETGQFQSVAWLSQETTAYMYPLAHAYRSSLPLPPTHAPAPRRHPHRSHWHRHERIHRWLIHRWLQSSDEEPNKRRETPALGAETREATPPSVTYVCSLNQNGTATGFGPGRNTRQH